MGAICKDCNGDMLKVKGCKDSQIKINGRWHDRNKTYWIDKKHRCHDCGAKYGMTHHLGCDVERCPKCGGQLISCDCNKTKIRFKG